MLRYIGDTPLANRTWRLYAGKKPTNWYLARYDLTPRGYCIFAWPDTSTEQWNIPCGMVDIPRAQVGALHRRLTTVSSGRAALPAMNESA